MSHTFHTDHDEAWHLNPIRDVDTAEAWDIRNSGRIAIVTLAAETRTLANPHFIGQELLLYMKTDGGDCVVTVTDGYDSAAKTDLTFSAVGDFVILRGVESGSDYRWRLQALDGAALSMDALLLGDDDTITFGTGSDVVQEFDGTSFNMGPASGFWADCPLVNWPGGHAVAYELYDDFLQLATGDAAGWSTDTTQGSASLGTGETSNTPGLGGYVTLNVQGTAEDWISFKATSADTGAAFKMTKDSGKKLWFETSIVVSAVADISFWIGLADQTMIEIGTDDSGVYLTSAGTDFVGFRTKNDASTELDQVCIQNDTETEVKANGATLAADTEIVLGMKFDGASTVTWYVNGTALADTIETDGSNFPDDIALTPFFFIKEGSGSAEDLFIDWVKVVQLR